MRPFRELRVWEDAHALTLRVYAVTATFPADERYGLTNQMRRSATSVPTNIAEGSARSDAEFHQFLTVALGSAAELEYQFILAHGLGYISAETQSSLDMDVVRVKRRLVTFLKALRANGQRPTAKSQEP